MKIVISCIFALALMATVMVEQTAARGPGAGARGGTIGRAPGGPRPAPAATGVQRPSTPPGALQAGGLTGGASAASGTLRNQAADAANNLSEHLGINASEARTTTSQALSQAAGQWSSGPKPFSPAWYAQHPQAWQYTHPHADAFVAASAAAVAGWLAVPVAAYGGSTSTTVIETTVPEESPAGKPQEPVGAEGSLDSAVEPSAADGGPWMGMGVFAINPPGQTSATQMVQLAVARDGTVRGSYYDLIGDTAQNIHGSINKASLRVFWSVGAKSGISFEAALDNLTRAEGNVTVHYPNGSTEAWKIRQVQR